MMKIGDIVYNERYGIGKIIDIIDKELPYGVEFKDYDSKLHNLNGRCKDGHGSWCTDDDEFWNKYAVIRPYKFTKKDLKTGDKLTTRGGAELIYDDSKYIFIDTKYIKTRALQFIVDLNEDLTMKTREQFIIDLNGDLTMKTREHSIDDIDDIVKVERPTYNTIFERKEEILDEKEKEYLAGVIRPFKDDIRYISKSNSINDNEYICIELNGESIILFPNFKKGTMYKGMEVNRKYTLEELGLD